MSYLLVVIFFLPSISLACMESKKACDEMKHKRIELDLIASNMANVNTTRTPEGGPYQRKIFVRDGVNTEIAYENKTKITYEPGHPDADIFGYVRYPDINMMEEMTNMLQATLDYEESFAACKHP